MTNHLFEREALPEMEALHRYALQLCRDDNHSRDLVQETMLKAYRYFHTYLEGTNCRAWLFQICRNSYINQYRRRSYEPVLIDFQEPATGVPMNERCRMQRMPGEIVGDKGDHADHVMSDEVQDALQDIPDDYQTAILLCDVEGYTYEEIAAFSRVPVGTVRSRIHRGRKMLAGRLARYAQQHGYDHQTSKEEL